MSSSEGVDILKNWHKTDATVRASSSGMNRGMPLAEDGVKVVSVTESELVVSLIKSGERERLKLDMVEFSQTIMGGGVALLLRFSDGKGLLLQEGI